MNENVWITGIGLLSCLGNGAQQHFDALMKPDKINVDEKTYEPYPVHALGDVAWEEQIPKRDSRQMGDWQQIGTYAAGLALQDAGIKDDEELARKTDMIVAARGSVCDIEVSREVLKMTNDLSDEQAQPIITQYLSDNLRPTLFLTQLPNLLAGNISIVHKITGSSRTLMGEEGAGIAAVQTAHARIRNGQDQIILVGGAFTSECLETLLTMELGGRLYKGEHKPISERMGNNQSGMIMGTVGAFIVLESKTHAQMRKANGYCEIDDVISDNCNRENGGVKNAVEKMMEKIGGQPDAIISGASGMEDVTRQEMEVLETTNAPIRCFGSKTGHGVEAQFPLSVALAALAVKNEGFYPPFEVSENERQEKVNNVMATAIGASQAEGIAMLSKVKV